MFDLYVPDDGTFQEYSVIGNCRELGSWKKPLKMCEKPTNIRQSFCEKSKIHNPESLKIYSAMIDIYRGKSKIHYYYIRKNSGNC